MASPSTTLSPALRARKQNRDRDLARLEQRIMAAVASTAPDLHQGDAGAGLGKAELNDILTSLADIKAAIPTKRARRILRRLLVSLAAKSGGKVELPDMEVIVHRPTSPFAPGNMAWARWLSGLLASFLLKLEHSDASEEGAASQILFSAIVNGGLLRSHLVRALPQAISKSVFAYDDLCWLDLPLPRPDGDKSQTIVRRWFPDPITQCLILRWRERRKKWPRVKAETLVMRLVTHLEKGSSSEQLPPGRTSLSRLIAVAETRLRLHMPALLVDYLGSTNMGQSLTTRAWWRVLCDFQLDEDSAAEPDTFSEDLGVLGLTRVPPTPGTPHAATDDFGALNTLLKAIRHEDKAKKMGRKEAIRNIVAMRAKAASGPGPMLSALIDWATWRLDKDCGHWLQPSSLSRYLHSFAKHLIALGGEVDPSSADEKDLEALYGEVLDAVRGISNRRISVVAVRQFHHYLVFRYGAMPVAIAGEVTGNPQVRANVVTHNEYAAAKKSIAQSQFDARQKQMLLIMLIFLFRLGLRRGELVHLRVGDIRRGPGERRPYLWVHAHPGARLKSSSSTRKLPLALLLTQEEAAQVSDWKRHRKSECRGQKADDVYLFARQGNNHAPLPDSDIDLLVLLTRDLAQDPTLVLHSFRHTFVSNIFSQMLLAGWSATRDNAVRQLDPSPRANQPWHDIQGQDGNFLARIFRQDYLPRGGAYQISTLAGQLEPTVTMTSYVHYQDYMAYLYVRDMASSYNKSLWAALEGSTVNALMARHSRQLKISGAKVLAHTDTPARMLAKGAIDMPQGRFSKRETRDSSPLDRHAVIGLARMPLTGIYFALTCTLESQNKIEREAVTGIDDATLELLERNTRYIADKKTSARNQKARRSRLVAPQKLRKRPPYSQYPQLGNFAPALPRMAPDKQLAHTAYQYAVSTNKDVSLDELGRLLLRTSASDPVLMHHDLEKLRDCTDLLSRLGIAHSRLRVTIRSLPRECNDAKKWLKHVKRKLGSKVGSVTLEKPASDMTLSISKHKHGRLAVEVVYDKRLASGWRVGCFYALAVLATDAGIDLAARWKKSLSKTDSRNLTSG